MKVAFTAFLFVCLATAGFAQTLKCRVCEKVIQGEYFRLEDKAHGGKLDVCKDCGNLETRCFACSLPLKSDSTKMADGRLLCARDAKDAITDDDEAKKICLATREELDRMFSRFLAFPATNIVLTIVDRFTLESLFKSPGFAKRCTAVFGATRSHDIGGQGTVHTINVLSGLSKARLQAVAAHEFSHAWLYENLRPERKAALSPDSIEAFCEFIAHNFMDGQKEEFEKKSIRENPYTRGQLDAFLAAETRYGFNTVLEWVKAGQSAKLDANDPDNVRQVAEENPSPTPTLFGQVTRTPPPLPEKLMLRNISGTAARRFAIINDRTFAVTDSAKIRLANTNLLVRCLEIRTNSVLIQIEGTDGKQELFLPQE